MAYHKRKRQTAGKRNVKKAVAAAAALMLACSMPFTCAVAAEPDAAVTEEGAADQEQFSDLMSEDAAVSEQDTEETLSEQADEVDVEAETEQETEAVSEEASETAPAEENDVEASASSGQDEQSDVVSTEEEAEPASEEAALPVETADAEVVSDVQDETATVSEDVSEEPEEPVAVVSASGTKATQKGLYEENGNLYYGLANGKLAKSKWIKVGKKSYYFAKDGAAVRHRTFRYKGVRYYASSKCVIREKAGEFNAIGNTFYAKKGGALCEKKIVKDGDNWYYYGADSTLKKNTLVNLDDIRYYANSKGLLVKDKMVKVPATGKRYYFGSDHEAYTDRVFKYKGNRYYAGPKGAIQSEEGKVKLGDKTYYVSKGGKLLRMQIFKTNTEPEKWFYYGADSTLKKNTLVNLDGVRYYANSKGLLVTDKMVKVPATGKRYYFGSDHEAYTKRVFDYKGERFYAGKNGVVRWQAGSFTAKGKEYYIEKAGRLVTKQVLKKDSGWYYYGKSSFLVKGKIVSWEGERYYADAETGRFQTESGFVTVGSNTYYVKSSGLLATDQWLKLDGEWHHFNKKAVRDEVSSTGPLDAMGVKAQDYYSATDYLILVNRDEHKVCIYQGSQGDWTQIKSFLCGNGKASTPTITGSYSIPNKYPRTQPYFDSGNARCWYPTRIHGGYLFHSVLYTQSRTPSTIIDGRVGVGVSHGCVRLQIDNAKWIYDNIPLSTKVVIY